MKTIFAWIVVSLIALPQLLHAQDTRASRVLVLTDIEADPDDTQSLIRLLLYVASDYGRAVKRGETSFTGNKVILWRWRDEIQNDFAARMDWYIKPDEEEIKINSA